MRIKQVTTWARSALSSWTVTSLARLITIATCIIECLIKSKHSIWTVLQALLIVQIHEIRELCVAGQTLISLIGIACFTWKYTYETNTESRNKLIKLIVIGRVSLYLKRVCQYIIRRILQWINLNFYFLGWFRLLLQRIIESQLT